MEEWLSIKQACEYLGMSESTVRRRIKEGKLQAQKVSNENGQQWFISSQSLQACKGYEQGQTLPTTKDIEAIQKGLLLTTHKAITEEIANAKEKLQANQMDLLNEVGQLADQVTQLQEANKQLLIEVKALREEKKKPLWVRLFGRS